MSGELNHSLGDRSPAELKSILLDSLLGTVGVLWIVGGIFAILNLYALHWALGWLSAFIWVWGCWAAALYFDVRKFLS